MSLLIKKSGILDTVQDLGRNNFRKFGINPNGVMDRTAARLLNILFGNDENSPVLEMHFPAAEIVFEYSAEFAIGGADFGATLNNLPTENYRIYHAEKDSILKFNCKTFGSRAYLTVAAGFKVENWLDSASTNLQNKIGGFSGRKLVKGDRLEFDNSATKTLKKNHHYFISPAILPLYSSFPTVRITAGAEFEMLADQSRNVFLNETFVIGNASNRMGYRLQGESLKLIHPFEMISSAVSFGTIQLLPNGQMIVLMADHQTSGGYPRIGNIIEIDLPLAAQLGAGDKIGFHLVTIEEAENLLIQLETDFKILKTAINYLKF